MSVLSDVASLNHYAPSRALARLRALKERRLTVFEAMRELSEVRAIPVKMKKTAIWVRTDTKGNTFMLNSLKIWVERFG